MPVIRISFLLLLATASLPAAAYIGPGSGISLLGGLGTFLVGFVLVLGAVLFWPIRYMIRRMRGRKKSGQHEQADEPAPPDGDGESSP